MIVYSIISNILLINMNRIIAHPSPDRGPSIPHGMTCFEGGNDKDIWWWPQWLKR